MRKLLPLLLAAGCTAGGGGTTNAYSEVCSHDATSEITDATGTFEVTADGAPSGLVPGTWVDGNGGLHVYTCVPDPESDILDRLNFDVWLALFELDDQPIDLLVNEDAESVNVLWGTVSDWDDVVTWTEDFLELQNGSSSFSEVDKQGRLVGTIDVTETDPAGHPMTIDIDLTW